MSVRNFVVTIDGKAYTVAVEEVQAGTVPAAAPAVAAPAAAPAPAAAAPAPAAAAPAPAKNVEGTKIVSPFPGLIKKLLVDEGATVAENQPILVLEAMKMDNDITATCAGRVSFTVAKGANVETDTVLAVIS